MTRTTFSRNTGHLLLLCICYAHSFPKYTSFLTKCNAYNNKKSSTQFFETLSTNSRYACALFCSRNILCDAITYASQDGTCSLYRNRDVMHITEPSADTELYLKVSDMSCPQNWVYYAGTSSCYYISTILKTFDDAMTYCWEEMGGYSTNVLNWNEYNFISSYLTEDTWTGIKRQSGAFKWISHLTLGPQNLAYTIWAPGEPFENSGCVRFWKDYSYKWDDGSCTNDRPFVCKKPADISC